VKSDMITPFLRRRHRMEPVLFSHPLLRDALGETYGVIVYHEQVMKVLAAVGGYDLTTADRIRRHLSDDAEVEAIRPDFLARAGARGVDGPTAELIWHHVAQFASFGFCKAHAAAFAVPTYQSAWLKAHFPAHFLAGVLTHEPGMYPRRLILEDARRHGIAILPLDVNVSEPEYTVEVLSEERTEPPSGYGIRLALKDVHGIADAEVRAILEARAERLFADVGDFLRRADVSRPVVEALAHAGAFDSLPGGSRRDRLFTAMTADAPREGEQVALPLGEAEVPRVLQEYTGAERVKAELEVVGMDASRRLISFYEPLLRDLGVTWARDLGDARGDTWVMIAGIKVASQTPAVRSGQRIIFLTLDDGTGLSDTTVFERVQPWCAKTIFHGFLLAVWGRLRRTGVRGASIIAEQVWDLTELSGARREGRLAEALAAGTGASQGGMARTLWHASPGSAG
jgi:error-prone DNA polymerase